MPDAGDAGGEGERITTSLLDNRLFSVVVRCVSIAGERTGLESKLVDNAPVDCSCTTTAGRCPRLPSGFTSREDFGKVRPRSPLTNEGEGE